MCLITAEVCDTYAEPAAYHNGTLEGKIHTKSRWTQQWAPQLDLQQGFGVSGALTAGTRVAASAMLFGTPYLLPGSLTICHFLKSAGRDHHRQAQQPLTDWRAVPVHVCRRPSPHAVINATHRDVILLRL
jgi:hypothetical protein